MIDYLTAAVRQQFRAWKLPVQVDLGPDRAVWSGPGNRIVIWRDEPGVERYEANKGSPAGDGRGHARGIRMLSATARVFASSTLDGAMRSDHERDCDAFVDCFLLVLYDWAKAMRIVHCPTGAMGFVRPPTADKPENANTYPGVIYDVHFQVPRGVHERVRETVTIAGVSTTAQLLGADAPETVPPPIVAPAHPPPDDIP